jgi:uncharacterized membrane protein (DUF2068 family)
MRARAPLDVDLEDKLLYGLTPMRLAYLVIGLVAGFGLWSSPWAPSAVRAFACAVVVVTGAIAAWGRWRGRAVDGCAADLFLFVISTRRLALDQRYFERLRRRSARAAPILPPRAPVVIVVTGRAPKAGATTVAVELAACLTAKGYSGELWSVRDAPLGHSVKPSPSEPLLSVASVHAGRVCYLDRGAGPSVAGVIPEDELVRSAARLNQATVIAFPEAAASKAFADLVDVIAATG